MAEEKKTQIQAQPDVAAKEPGPKESAGKTRRDFMGFSFAAALSGLLLPEVLSPEAEAQVSGALCAPQIGPELANPGELASSGGYLKGLVDLKVDTRSVTYIAPGPPVPPFNAQTTPGACKQNVGFQQRVQNTNYVCGQHKLRAYFGYPGYAMKNSVSPVGKAYPGPTLRAALGDKVNLIFLNRIDPTQFNYASQISVAPGACDTSVSVAPGGASYPGTDNFPNCFHVSNTTNLHFHGTHTDPGGFGDNVLLGIMPNPNINVDAAIKLCVSAFDDWAAGKNPSKRMQDAATAMLNQLMAAAKKNNQPDMVAQITAALHANQADVAAGEWPQYWPGFYPYHFELPVYSGSPTKFPTMGQSPGSHWYHCHQHGSTTIQLLNGMAGALIIQDLSPTGYDGAILSLGGGTPQSPKIKEKVVLLQLFSEQPNRINQAAPGLTVSPTATVTVNGQMVPKITMKQGEVQWWRVIDAAMKAHGVEQFFWIDQDTYNGLLAQPCNFQNGPPLTIDQTKVPNLRQIAQDGVQFKWDNYYRFYTNAAKNKNFAFNITPGNRMDFLVKAPAANGTSYLVFWPPNLKGVPGMQGSDVRQVVVLSVTVDGPPDSSTNTAWFDVPGATDPKQMPPPPAGYPQFPDFLGDIPKPTHSRTVTFSMQGGPGSQPFFYIDGKQFAEGRVDQTMMKDTIEEWTVVNTSQNAVMHPFHIHINPFQITHYFDPNDPSTNKDELPQPWIWADTKPIPAAKTNADGTITPGYFTMRSRFADFVGKYVIHCHILGHEDRGMMQLVQVVNNETVVRHH